MSVSMTLVVDSSLCPDTRAAGWGLWCKRDGWQSGKSASGPITTQPQDSAEAELIGIVEAIRFLFSEVVFEDVSVLTLQCDNIETLLILAECPNVRCARSVDIRDLDVRYSEHARRSSLLAYTQRFRKHKEEFFRLTRKMKIWVRHVKGHKGKVTTRHSVNELCDRLAKTQMRAIRKALQPVVA